MPRQQVNDLNKINLGGAARQVNTFVFAPRAAKDNSALQLSRALTGVGEIVQEHKQQEIKLNVEKATADKLYGGTLFTSTVEEATAEYEAVKGTLGTVEDAEMFFLDRTTPEDGFQSGHTGSGYREAQLKALGKFRAAHADYLVQQGIERRGRDVMNDFFFTSKTEGADTAFSRLRTIADNFGMEKDDIDQVPLGAAEILISQNRFDEARGILENKRGGAGSLLDRPNTAVEAQKLMSKIQTEDSINIANQIKDLEDTNEAANAYSDEQKQRLDSLLETGNITVNKRNTLLQANEEAVNIENISNKFAENLSTPGRNFFDPIEGATPEQADKARERFTDKFYEQSETARISGKTDPLSFTKRIVKFSEKTNTTSPAIKSRLGLGYSLFNPQKIVETDTVDPNILASVGEYATLYKENPQVAAAHTPNAETREFYDAMVMDMTLGGLPGTPQEKLELAIKNYAQDLNNPIQGTGQAISVSTQDILDQFSTVTDKAAGVSFFNNSGDAASNGQQWVPYIRRQVQQAARRTGSQDTVALTKHVVEQIVNRSDRIGDYLVPKGTNTYQRTYDDLQNLNDNAVGRYIRENPEDGYEEDDLVLTPVVGQRNMWGVSVKGSNQILELIPHTELPLSPDAPRREAPVLKKETAPVPSEPIGKLGQVEPTERKILDFVAQPESNGSYNVIFGGSEKPLTTMTVQQVLDLQGTMKDGSTAVGRYQFINDTLKELIEKLDVPKDAKFDEDLQDRLGKALLERRGLKKFKAGKLGKAKFIENLAKEWASLPKDASGLSYYDGDGLNKSLVAHADLEKLVDSL